MPRRSNPTPTGQDGSRRELATRRVRLATAAAGAAGIALVGTFVQLASAATHKSSTTNQSSTTPTTSPYVPDGGSYYQGDDGGSYYQPPTYQGGGGYVQPPTYQGGGGYPGGGGPVSGAS